MKEMILLLSQGQDGWSKLLERFHGGGGELLDVEFIVDDHGKMTCITWLCAAPGECGLFAVFGLKYM